MSAYLKKGIAVWILGFITFLGALNTLHAVRLGALEYTDSTIQLHIISDIAETLLGTREMRVMDYFWASTTLTFVFLGLTAIAATRKPPLDPALVKMFVKLDGDLEANRKTLENGLEENKNALENARIDLLDGIAANKKASEKLLTDARIQMMGELQEHGKIIRKIIQSVREEVLSSIETNVRNLGQETLTALGKQRSAIQKVERMNKRSAKTMEKQIAELTDMRTRVERIEREFTRPQPKLASLDKPEDVKGIGPRLAEELKATGITSVGELVTADPATIGEKTRVSQEMAKNLQATAQLLMIPGVDKNDAELLKEVEVFTIRELAEQDPIQLSAKLTEVANTYVKQGKITESEKPTVEEVLSWVKYAKY